jgi:hypothetical protein
VYKVSRRDGTRQTKKKQQNKKRQGIWEKRGGLMVEIRITPVDGIGSGWKKDLIRAGNRRRRRRSVGNLRFLNVKILVRRRGRGLVGRNVMLVRNRKLGWNMLVIETVP